MTVSTGQRKSNELNQWQFRKNRRTEKEMVPFVLYAWWVNPSAIFSSQSNLFSLNLLLPIGPLTAKKNGNFFKKKIIQRLMLAICFCYTCLNGVIVNVQIAHKKGLPVRTLPAELVHFGYASIYFKIDLRSWYIKLRAHCKWTFRMMN